MLKDNEKGWNCGLGVMCFGEQVAMSILVPCCRLYIKSPPGIKDSQMRRPN